MRVPMSWMAEYCDTGLEPDVLAERMAMTGTEVERVVTSGPVSGHNFVIAHVDSIEKHPDADKLNVCQVNTGDTVRTIVCGAPNVAAGQTVVAVLPGAVMPGGMEIVKRKLRGVESDGMICSERELELGEGHDGIMVLEDGLAEPGTPAADVIPLSEAVLELEVTPNRTDCFSIFGVAREAHVITGSDLAPAPWDGLEIGDGSGSAEAIKVTVEDSDFCPRFTARAFTDVKVGPSPLWLRARLIAAGQRPINNVVDITNYVMLLTGQPMHAYDLDKVPGGELTVRKAKKGEKVATLDGQTREIPEGVGIVCDRNGPAGIAGLMGGAEDEVTEGTVSVLMESANWHGPSILLASRDLNLRSEASSRFEKQLHPELATRAQLVATELMVSLCGATAASGMVDVGDLLPAPAPVRLRAGRVERILGMAVDTDSQVEVLRELGFGVEIDTENLDSLEDDPDLLVSVPVDRHFDVTREIDLVEEIARVNDLDRKLPATLPSAANRVGGLSRQQLLQRRAEDAMRESGFDEIVGWSFTDPGELTRLRIEAPDPRAVVAKLANPLSEDQSVMRTTLLGSALDAAQRNLSRGADSVSLFESGRVYLPGTKAGPGPLGGTFPGHQTPPATEPQKLTALAVGAVDPQSWREKPPVADFFTLKGVLEKLALGLGVEVSVKPGSEPFLHPGKSGEVFIGEESIGWIGQIHPAVASLWDLTDAVAFEIGLAELLEASNVSEETYVDFTAFPPVDRDIAAVVPETVDAAEVIGAVTGPGGELLQSVEVFDVYRGDQVGEGEKSLAMRLQFRALDRTLSDEEVDPLMKSIVESLGSIGGSLRGETSQPAQAPEQEGSHE